MAKSSFGRRFHVSEVNMTRDEIAQAYYTYTNAHEQCLE